MYRIDAVDMTLRGGRCSESPCCQSPQTPAVRARRPLGRAAPWLQRSVSAALRGVRGPVQAAGLGRLHPAAGVTLQSGAGSPALQATASSTPPHRLLRRPPRHQSGPRSGSRSGSRAGSRAGSRSDSRFSGWAHGSAHGPHRSRFDSRSMAVVGRCPVTPGTTLCRMRHLVSDRCS